METSATYEWKMSEERKRFEQEQHIGVSHILEADRIIETFEHRIRIKDKTIDAANLVNAGLTKQVTDLRSALDKARADVTRLRKQNASLLATMHERKLESRTRVPKGLERAKKPVSR